MPLADWSEWEKAIRTAWLADATFAAMLGAADAFLMKGQPEGQVPYPMAVWTTNRRGKSLVDNGEGIYRPDISISFFATSSYRTRDIADYAAETFRMPSNFWNQLLTDNWKVEILTCLDVMDGGFSRQMNTGEMVYEMVTDWQAKICRRT